MSRYYRIELEVTVPEQRTLASPALQTVLKTLGEWCDVEETFTGSAGRIFDGVRRYSYSGNVTLTGGMSEEEWHRAVVSDLRNAVPNVGMESSFWYEDREPDAQFNTEPDFTQTGE